MNDVISDKSWLGDQDLLRVNSEMIFNPLSDFHLVSILQQQSFFGINKLNVCEKFYATNHFRAKDMNIQKES